MPLNRIYITSSEEFNTKYPNWSDTINGKYDNFPRERYIVKEPSGGYTAIDNTSGDAWCEDFKTFNEARTWLEH